MIFLIGTSMIWTPPLRSSRRVVRRQSPPSRGARSPKARRAPAAEPGTSALARAAEPDCPDTRALTRRPIPPKPRQFAGPFSRHREPPAPGRNIRRHQVRGPCVIDRSYDVEESGAAPGTVWLSDRSQPESPRKKTGRRCRIGAEMFVAGVSGRARGASPTHGRFGRTNSAAANEIGVAVRSNRTTTKPARRELRR